MACSCSKRKVTQQAVRKAAPKPTPRTRITNGRRIINRVIR